MFTGTQRHAATLERLESGKQEKMKITRNHPYIHGWRGIRPKKRGPRPKSRLKDCQSSQLPQVRLYLFFQDYELVRKREVNDIVNLVKDILKEGEIIKKKKKQKAGKEEKEKEEKSLRDEL